MAENPIKLRWEYKPGQYGGTVGRHGRIAIAVENEAVGLWLENALNELYDRRAAQADTALRAAKFVELVGTVVPMDDRLSERLTEAYLKHAQGGRDAAQSEPGHPPHQEEIPRRARDEST